MVEIKYEKLFSEFKLKNLTLRNRIVWLPHNTGYATMDSLPNEAAIYYYAERAKGGVSLIVSGNYAVSKSGQMHRTFVNASDESVIPNFTETANLVHKYGAKIIGQITHCGPTKMEKPQSDLWAPSQVIEGSSGAHTVEMDRDEMKCVITSFVKTANNLIRSNFDGIEVKVAHDGLLRAFISPHYNKRSDEYGGSFKNRMRFVTEVFSAIRQSIGEDTVLGIRLCMDEFEDDGYKLEDGIQIAKFLEEKKLIDYVSTDAGTTWLSFIMQIPTMSVPLGYAEYMSYELKKEVKIPVIAFGRINDPLQAEQILQNESADLIGMARQLICDPETPIKAEAGDIDQIRKCTACIDGCIGQGLQYQPIRCIHNPAVGREKSLGIGTLVKSKKKKKIVVVGGGVAGMKFAEVAAKRGHRIILFEKEKVLGGQINYVKKIPFRNEFSEITHYLEYQIKNNKNIEIRLDFEANEKDILKESPDAVIVATGARRYVPKEFRNKKVFTSIDILSGNVEIGKNVVIYDKLAKEEGIGMADYLCEFYEDTKIKFFSPANQTEGGGVNFINLDTLYRKLYPKGVEFFSFYELMEVRYDKLTFINMYSRKKKYINNYDNLIHVGDSESINQLYKDLKGKIKEVYRLGDSKAPRIVELAISTADELARNI